MLTSLAFQVIETTCGYFGVLESLESSLPSTTGVNLYPYGHFRNTALQHATTLLVGGFGHYGTGLVPPPAYHLKGMDHFQTESNLYDHSCKDGFHTSNSLVLQRRNTHNYRSGFGEDNDASDGFKFYKPPSDFVLQQVSAINDILTPITFIKRYEKFKLRPPLKVGLHIISNNEYDTSNLYGAADIHAALFRLEEDHYGKYFEAFFIRWLQYLKKESFHPELLPPNSLHSICNKLLYSRAFINYDLYGINALNTLFKLLNAQDFEILRLLYSTHDIHGIQDLQQKEHFVPDNSLYLVRLLQGALKDQIIQMIHPTDVHNRFSKKIPYIVHFSASPYKAMEENHKIHIRHIHNLIIPFLTDITHGEVFPKIDGDVVPVVDGLQHNFPLESQYVQPLIKRYGSHALDETKYLHGPPEIQKSYSPFPKYVKVWPSSYETTSSSLLDTETKHLDHGSGYNEYADRGTTDFNDEQERTLDHVMDKHFIILKPHLEKDALRTNSRALLIGRKDKQQWSPTPYEGSSYQTSIHSVMNEEKIHGSKKEISQQSFYDGRQHMRYITTEPSVLTSSDPLSYHRTSADWPEKPDVFKPLLSAKHQNSLLVPVNIKITTSAHVNFGQHIPVTYNPIVQTMSSIEPLILSNNNKQAEINVEKKPEIYGAGMKPVTQLFPMVLDRDKPVDVKKGQDGVLGHTVPENSFIQQDKYKPGLQFMSAETKPTQSNLVSYQNPKDLRFIDEGFHLGTSGRSEARIPQELPYVGSGTITVSEGNPPEVSDNDHSVHSPLIFQGQIPFNPTSSVKPVFENYYHTKEKPITVRSETHKPKPTSHQLPYVDSGTITVSEGNPPEVSDNDHPVHSPLIFQGQIPFNPTSSVKPVFENYYHTKENPITVRSEIHKPKPTSHQLPYVDSGTITVSEGNPPEVSDNDHPVHSPLIFQGQIPFNPTSSVKPVFENYYHTKENPITVRSETHKPKPTSHQLPYVDSGTITVSEGNPPEVSDNDHPVHSPLIFQGQIPFNPTSSVKPVFENYYHTKEKPITVRSETHKPKPTSHQLPYVDSGTITVSEGNPPEVSDNDHPVHSPLIFQGQIPFNPTSSVKPVFENYYHTKEKPITVRFETHKPKPTSHQLPYVDSGTITVSEGNPPEVSDNDHPVHSPLIFQGQIPFNPTSSVKPVFENYYHTKENPITVRSETHKPKPTSHQLPYVDSGTITVSEGNLPEVSDNDHPVHSPLIFQGQIPFNPTSSVKPVFDNYYHTKEKPITVRSETHKPKPTSHQLPYFDSGTITVSEGNPPEVSDNDHPVHSPLIFQGQIPFNPTSSVKPVFENYYHTKEKPITVRSETHKPTSHQLPATPTYQHENINSHHIVKFRPQHIIQKPPTVTYVKEATSDIPIYVTESVELGDRKVDMGTMQLQKPMFVIKKKTHQGPDTLLNTLNKNSKLPNTDLHPFSSSFHITPFHPHENGPLEEANTVVKFDFKKPERSEVDTPYQYPYVDQQVTDHRKPLLTPTFSPGYTVSTKITTPVAPVLSTIQGESQIFSNKGIVSGYTPLTSQPLKPTRSIKPVDIHPSFVVKSIVKDNSIMPINNQTANSKPADKQETNVKDKKTDSVLSSTQKSGSIKPINLRQSIQHSLKRIDSHTGKPFQSMQEAVSHLPIKPIHVQMEPINHNPTKPSHTDHGTVIQDRAHVKTQSIIPLPSKYTQNDPHLDFQHLKIFDQIGPKFSIQNSLKPIPEVSNVMTYPVRHNHITHNSPRISDFWSQPIIHPELKLFHVLSTPAIDHSFFHNQAVTIRPLQQSFHHSNTDSPMEPTHDIKIVPQDIKKHANFKSVHPGDQPMNLFVTKPLYPVVSVGPWSTSHHPVIHHTLQPILIRTPKNSIHSGSRTADYSIWKGDDNSHPEKLIYLTQQPRLDIKTVIHHPVKPTFARPQTAIPHSVHSVLAISQSNINYPMKHQHDPSKPVSIRSQAKKHYPIKPKKVDDLVSTNPEKTQLVDQHPKIHYPKKPKQVEQPVVIQPQKPQLVGPHYPKKPKNVVQPVVIQKEKLQLVGPQPYIYYPKEPKKVVQPVVIHTEKPQLVHSYPKMHYPMIPEKVVHPVNIHPQTRQIVDPHLDFHFPKKHINMVQPVIIPSEKPELVHDLPEIHYPIKPVAYPVNIHPQKSELVGPQLNFHFPKKPKQVVQPVVIHQEKPNIFGPPPKIHYPKKPKQVDQPLVIHPEKPQVVDSHPKMLYPMKSETVVHPVNIHPQTREIVDPHLDFHFPKKHINIVQPVIIHSEKPKLIDSLPEIHYSIKPIPYPVNIHPQKRELVGPHLNFHFPKKPKQVVQPVVIHSQKTQLVGPHYPKKTKKVVQPEVNHQEKPNIFGPPPKIHYPKKLKQVVQPLVIYPEKPQLVGSHPYIHYPEKPKQVVQPIVIYPEKPQLIGSHPNIHYPKKPQKVVQPVVIHPEKPQLVDSHPKLRYPIKSEKVVHPVNIHPQTRELVGSHLDFHYPRKQINMVHPVIIHSEKPEFVDSLPEINYPIKPENVVYPVYIHPQKRELVGPHLNFLYQQKPTQVVQTVVIHPEKPQLVGPQYPKKLKKVVQPVVITPEKPKLVGPYPNFDYPKKPKQVVQPVVIYPEKPQLIGSHPDIHYPEKPKQVVQPVVIHPKKPQLFGPHYTKEHKQVVQPVVIHPEKQQLFGPQYPKRPKQVVEPVVNHPEKPQLVGPHYPKKPRKVVQPVVIHPKKPKLAAPHPNIHYPKKPKQVVQLVRIHPEKLQLVGHFPNKPKQMVEPVVNHPEKPQLFDPHYPKKPINVVQPVVIHPKKPKFAAPHPNIHYPREQKQVVGIHPEKPQLVGPHYLKKPKQVFQPLVIHPEKPQLIGPHYPEEPKNLVHPVVIHPEKPKFVGPHPNIHYPKRPKQVVHLMGIHPEKPQLVGSHYLKKPKQVVQPLVIHPEKSQLVGPHYPKKPRKVVQPVVIHPKKPKLVDPHPNFHYPKKPKMLIQPIIIHTEKPKFVDSHPEMHYPIKPEKVVHPVNITRVQLKTRQHPDNGLVIPNVVSQTVIQPLLNPNHVAAQPVKLHHPVKLAHIRSFDPFLYPMRINHTSHQGIFHHPMKLNSAKPNKFEPPSHTLKPVTLETKPISFHPLNTDLERIQPSISHPMNLAYLQAQPSIHHPVRISNGGPQPDIHHPIYPLNFGSQPVIRYAEKSVPVSSGNPVKLVDIWTDHEFPHSSEHFHTGIQPLVRPPGKSIKVGVQSVTYQPVKRDQIEHESMMQYPVKRTFSESQSVMNRVPDGFQLFIHPNIYKSTKQIPKEYKSYFHHPENFIHNASIPVIHHRIKYPHLAPSHTTDHPVKSTNNARQSNIFTVKPIVNWSLPVSHHPVKPIHVKIESFIQQSTSPSHDGNRTIVDHPRKSTYVGLQPLTQHRGKPVQSDVYHPQPVTTHNEPNPSAELGVKSVNDWKHPLIYYEEKPIHLQHESFIHPPKKPTHVGPMANTYRQKLIANDKYPSVKPLHVRTHSVTHGGPKSLIYNPVKSSHVVTWPLNHPAKPFVNQPHTPEQVKSVNAGSQTHIRYSLKPIHVTHKPVIPFLVKQIHVKPRPVKLIHVTPKPIAHPPVKEIQSIINHPMKEMHVPVIPHLVVHHTVEQIHVKPQLVTRKTMNPSQVTPKSVIHFPEKQIHVKPQPIIHHIVKHTPKKPQTVIHQTQKHIHIKPQPVVHPKGKQIHAIHYPVKSNQIDSQPVNKLQAKSIHIRHPAIDYQENQMHVLLQPLHIQPQPFINSSLKLILPSVVKKPVKHNYIGSLLTIHQPKKPPISMTKAATYHQAKPTHIDRNPDKLTEKYILNVFQPVKPIHINDIDIIHPAKPVLAEPRLKLMKPIHVSHVQHQTAKSIQLNSVSVIHHVVPQPSILHKKPTQVVPQPSIRLKEPTQVVPQVSIRHKKPTQVVPQPSIPHKKLQVVPQHSIRHKNPTQVVHQPSIHHKKPIEVIPQPSIHHKKPTQVVSQPSIPRKKPAQVVPQPSIRYKKPTQVVPQPSIRHKKPTQVVHQPSIHHKKPTQVVHKPSIHLKKPTQVVPQPSIRHKKPTQVVPQPSIPRKKPTQVMSQPSIRHKKPTQVLPQPSIWHKKPTHVDIHNSVRLLDTEAQPNIYYLENEPYPGRPIHFESQYHVPQLMKRGYNLKTAFPQERTDAETHLYQNKEIDFLGSLKSINRRGHNKTIPNQIKNTATEAVYNRSPDHSIFLHHLETEPSADSIEYSSLSLEDSHLKPGSPGNEMQIVSEIERPFYGDSHSSDIRYSFPTKDIEHNVPQPSKINSSNHEMETDDVSIKYIETEPSNLNKLHSQYKNNIFLKHINLTTKEPIQIFNTDPSKSIDSRNYEITVGKRVKNLEHIPRNTPELLETVFTEMHIRPGKEHHFVDEPQILDRGFHFNIKPIPTEKNKSSEEESIRFEQGSPPKPIIIENAFIHEINSAKDKQSGLVMQPTSHREKIHHFIEKNYHPKLHSREMSLSSSTKPVVTVNRDIKSDKILRTKVPSVAKSHKGKFTLIPSFHNEQKSIKSVFPSFTIQSEDFFKSVPLADEAIMNKPVVTSFANIKHFVGKPLHYPVIPIMNSTLNSEKVTLFPFQKEAATIIHNSTYLKDPVIAQRKYSYPVKSFKQKISHPQPFPSKSITIREPTPISLETNTTLSLKPVLVAERILFEKKSAIDETPGKISIVMGNSHKFRPLTYKMFFDKESKTTRNITPVSSFTRIKVPNKVILKRLLSGTEKNNKQTTKIVNIKPSSEKPLHYSTIILKSVPIKKSKLVDKTKLTIGNIKPSQQIILSTKQPVLQENFRTFRSEMFSNSKGDTELRTPSHILSASVNKLKYAFPQLATPKHKYDFPHLATYKPFQTLKKFNIEFHKSHNVEGIIPTLMKPIKPHKPDHINKGQSMSVKAFSISLNDMKTAPMKYSSNVSQIDFFAKNTKIFQNKELEPESRIKFFSKENYYPANEFSKPSGQILMQSKIKHFKPKRNKYAGTLPLPTISSELVKPLIFHELEFNSVHKIPNPARKEHERLIRTKSEFGSQVNKKLNHFAYVEKPFMRPKLLTPRDKFAQRTEFLLDEYKFPKESRFKFQDYIKPDTFNLNLLPSQMFSKTELNSLNKKGKTHSSIGSKALNSFKTSKVKSVYFDLSKPSKHIFPQEAKSMLNIQKSEERIVRYEGSGLMKHQKAVTFDGTKPIDHKRTKKTGSKLFADRIHYASDNEETLTPADKFAKHKKLLPHEDLFPKGPSFKFQEYNKPDMFLKTVIKPLEKKNEILTSIKPELMNAFKNSKEKLVPSDSSKYKLPDMKKSIKHTQTKVTPSRHRVSHANDMENLGLHGDEQLKLKKQVHRKFVSKNKRKTISQVNQKNRIKLEDANTEASTTLEFEDIHSNYLFDANIPYNFGNENYYDPNEGKHHDSDGKYRKTKNTRFLSFEDVNLHEDNRREGIYPYDKQTVHYDVSGKSVTGHQNNFRDFPYGDNGRYENIYKGYVTGLKTSRQTHRKSMDFSHNSQISGKSKSVITNKMIPYSTSDNMKTIKLKPHVSLNHGDVGIKLQKARSSNTEARSYNIAHYEPLEDDNKVREYSHERQYNRKDGTHGYKKGNVKPNFFFGNKQEPEVGDSLPGKRRSLTFGRMTAGNKIRTSTADDKLSYKKDMELENIKSLKHEVEKGNVISSKIGFTEKRSGKGLKNRLKVKLNKTSKNDIVFNILLS